MPLAQVYDPDAISIHAPREGCDTSSTGTWKEASYFNPRTP